MASADFTPDLLEYTGQKPLRYWVQKALPLVYDDSLSYYEVLAKLVKRINDLQKAIEDLYDSYEQLETYVNRCLYEEGGENSDEK